MSTNTNKQVGAELCQAQVKLEVVDEVVAEDGCRGCSWSKPHAVWFKVTTCLDGWVDKTKIMQCHLLNEVVVEVEDASSIQELVIPSHLELK